LHSHIVVAFFLFIDNQNSKEDSVFSQNLNEGSSS
jgi:hypothetical protein